MEDSQVLDHPQMSKAKNANLYFDVYRFEIERGRQVAGNILAGVIGAINCSQGSKEECANISISDIEEYKMTVTI